MGDPIHVVAVHGGTSLAPVMETVSRPPYVCACHRTGAEALEGIRELKPALVVCAWALPDMDAPELCRRIRCVTDGYRPALAVLIPPDAPEGRFAAAFDAGINECITVPMARAEVSARLAALVARRLPAGESVSRAVIDSVPESIITVDAKGTIVFANPAASRMFGYFPEELAGAEMARLLPATQRDRHQGIFAGLSGSAGSPQLPFVREVTALQKGGNPMLVEVAVNRTVTTAGALYTVLARDIRGRRVVEEQLRKLSRAVEQSPATVVITDTRGLIEYVNPAFTRITGYTPVEVYHENPRVLKSGVHPPEFYQSLWETIASGHEWRGEFCNRKKSGELYWESASISPVRNDKGTVTHYVAVKEDVTEQHRVGHELQAAKEAADAANRAKSQFLANMSHEIRTPLNAIIGFASLLLEAPSAPRERDYANKIRTAGEQLLATINDILDFSRIEAGKLSLERVGFHLDELLDDVAALVLPRAVQKGLAFSMAIAADVPYTAVGDPLRLEQVLLNLLSNAVKFTERGSVRLSIDLRGETESEVTLAFAVADTGIGLSESQLQALFRPFTQADSSTTRRYGGSGLGLNISRQLVEMFSGSIEVSSSPGAGSTFAFTVRLGRSAGAPPERRRSLLPSLAGKRILLVGEGSAAYGCLPWFLAGAGLEVVREPDPARAPDAIVVGPAASLSAPPPLTGPRAVVVALLDSPADWPDERLPSSCGVSTLLETLGRHLGKRGPPGRAAAPPDGTTGFSLRGARILLAEDNDVNVEITRILLERAGAIVDVAGTGREALRMASDTPAGYDCVLMDIQMPDMDGYEATRQMRRIPRLAGLRIVALTADAMPEERARALASGMDDYLTKPIDQAALLAALERRRGRGQAAAPPPPAEARASGIAIEASIERLGGDRDLYERLLGLFVAGQRGADRRIADALSAHDYELATRLAHTLKGASGNIGAEGLRRASAAAEACIRRDPAAASTWDAVAELRVALEAVIRDLSARAASAPAGESDRRGDGA